MRPARPVAACWLVLAGACSTGSSDGLAESTARVETPTREEVVDVRSCGLDRDARAVFLVASGEGVGVQALIPLDDDDLPVAAEAGLTVTTATGTLAAGIVPTAEDVTPGDIGDARVEGDRIVISGEGRAVAGSPVAGPISVRARCGVDELA